MPAIDKEYLEKQVVNLEQQKAQANNIAHLQIQNVAAIEGSIQTLKQLIAYSEIPAAQEAGEAQPTVSE